MTDSTQGASDGQSKVVIRDRRRIDPQTGAPRQIATTRVGAEETADAASSAPDAPVASADELAAATTQLAERTADLKRVTAEYANYRKRVDRDRTLAADQATAAVLTGLLPVLDDLDRARAHGDLTGAFGAVAEQLVNVLTKLGLEPFGEEGDPFDPTWHEAVAHTTSPDVDEPTCVEVLRRGYSLGERLLRPAMVAVAAPGGDGDGSGDGGPAVRDEAGAAGDDAAGAAPATDAPTGAGGTSGSRGEDALAADGQDAPAGEHPRSGAADDPDRVGEVSDDAAQRG